MARYTYVCIPDLHILTMFPELVGQFMGKTMNLEEGKMHIMPGRVQVINLDDLDELPVREAPEKS